MGENEVVLEQYIRDDAVKYIITRHRFTNEYYFKIPQKKGFKTISASFHGDFQKEKQKWTK